MSVMSVSIQFELGNYTVQESCVMLPIKLLVMGKVINPFTVGIIPTDNLASAKGM